MFTCFQGNFGLTPGSAIFGSLIPKSKAFISSVSMQSQDSNEQSMPQFFGIFQASHAAMPMPQFIGTF